MRRDRMLVAGTALLAAGVAGLLLVPIVSTALGGRSGTDRAATEGERIYLTGAGVAGPVPRASAGPGMMGGAACVDCHGTDGRGGIIGTMWGDVEVPDIRYSSLTASRSLEGTVTPGWTDAGIARAIRGGIEPDGQRLQAPMPRWDLSGPEMRSLIAYLKELSAR